MNYRLTTQILWTFFVIWTIPLTIYMGLAVIGGLLEDGIKLLFNPLTCLVIFNTFILIRTRNMLLDGTEVALLDKNEVLICLGLLLLAFAIHIGGFFWLLCNFEMGHPGLE